MNKNTHNNARFLISTSLVALIIAGWCSQLAAINRDYLRELNNKKLFNMLKIHNINKNVLDLALRAHNKARSLGYGQNNHLTIVDYSLPSTEPRMWVIDMENQTLLYHTHVAHGIGSGQNYAEKFSNQPGSGMSSLGLYLTGEIYNGRYGLSLKLHGLENHFNSNALKRGIVMHQASYVDTSIISRIGRLGRSLGCLAVNKSIANKLMHKIKSGSLVFCYYPDQTWLTESTMLKT